MSADADRPSTSAEGRSAGITRNQLLRGAAASVPALMLGGAARDALAAGGPEALAAATSLRGMNVVMFITDQERAIQHFPKGWAEKNLPGLQRLKRNGLVFENAFTNACMCSPSRATLLTGFMPSQHQVRYTLESDMPAAQYPQVELSTGLKNIASVMASVGYNVVWKGKFHLTKAPIDAQGNELWSPADLAKYGFARWNPADAGANQNLSEGGGNPQPTGEGDNDARYMTADGDAVARAGGRAGVPELGRGEGAAVLPRRVARQPARRPLLPEELRQLRLPGRRPERPDRAAGDRRREPVAQADRAGLVQAHHGPERRAAAPVQAARLPELLRAT